MPGSRRRVSSSVMLDPSYSFTTVLAAALADAGVRHACITPGSRSTPLALPLADHPAITDWSHHDERASAFFALGIGKATGSPAVVVTTSGTAAAHLHAAALEARAGRVPLILITADRPADLRDVGAPQAVDQAGLFGDAVKWSHDLEPPDPSRSSLTAVAALAARLVAVATEVPAGPVHLNVRLREPLLPTGEVPETPPAPAFANPIPTAAPGVLDDLANRLEGRRALLVCGPQDDPALGPAAASLAERTGIPVIADPLSQVRCGHHDLSRVIATGDLLAGAGWLGRVAPEVVVRVGALPTSKPLWRWLEDHREVEQVVVDPGGWRDPLASASRMVRSDPVAALEGLTDRIGRPVPPDWTERWQSADRAAGAALAAALSGFPTEPGIVRTVVEALPDGATLWVASSMPVRDLDLVAPTTRRDLRFAANRGANGIDGFLSSGLGAAAAGGRPTVLLAGDLSMLHDLTGLAAAGRLGIPAAIVVIDNDGGGIFHFLPQAGLSHFERHFGTPHRLDLVAVAGALGVTARTAASPADLAAEVASPPTALRLTVVRTDRTTNVEVHRRLREAVGRALEDC